MGALGKTCLGPLPVILKQESRGRPGIHLCLERDMCVLNLRTKHLSNAWTSEPEVTTQLAQEEELQAQKRVEGDFIHSLSNHPGWEDPRPAAGATWCRGHTDPSASC